MFKVLIIIFDVRSTLKKYNSPSSAELSNMEKYIAIDHSTVVNKGTLIPLLIANLLTHNIIIIKTINVTILLSIVIYLATSYLIRAPPFIN